MRLSVCLSCMYVLVLRKLVLDANMAYIHIICMYVLVHKLVYTQLERTRTLEHSNTKVSRTPKNTRTQLKISRLQQTRVGNNFPCLGQKVLLA